MESQKAHFNKLMKQHLYTQDLLNMITGADETRREAIRKLEEQRDEINRKLMKLRDEQDKYDKIQQELAEEYKQEQLQNELAQAFRDEQQDTFPDWSNYEETPFKLPVPKSNSYNGMNATVEQLKTSPFDVIIDLSDIKDDEYQEVAKQLGEWFENTIVPQLAHKKMLVEYQIRGRKHPFRQPVISELDRLRSLFDENALYKLEEDTSGIESGKNGKLCMEWVDSIKFIDISDNVERPDSRRSNHMDGFFPRKLSGNYKLLEPWMEELQIFSSYTDSNGKVKPSVNVACFIHSLRVSGVEEDLLTKIASFVGFQKRISRNVWSEIGNAFGLRFHLQIYNKKGKIDNANQNNNGWYGPKEGKEIRLAEYLDHVFVDKELPINLFAINNWDKLCEISGENKGNDSLHGDSKSPDVARMLKARKFDEKAGYKIENARAKATSLAVVIAIDKNNGFELIDGTDSDVIKANIYSSEIEEPEVIAAPYNEKLHTRKIQRKYIKKDNEPREKWYADFETAQKQLSGHKNAKSEQIPFMLCATNQDGTIERTYIGASMIEDMLNEIPNKSIIYFHNLGFDGNFLYKYACKDIIKKGNKIMSMEVEFNKKVFTLKDSYSLLPEKLAKFPVLFPAAFAETNIKKEFMPYEYFNYTRIFCNQAIGNITECVREMNLTKEEEKILTDNINSIPECLLNTNGDFDMMKYCEFYCLQDIRVLRIGFEAYAEAARKEPICIDVHEVLTVPSLAAEYMNKHVFYPNGNVYELNGSVQKFIQGAVYGGRCMTANNFRYKVMKELDDFDACSLYPSAMARMFVVEGIPEFYESPNPETIYDKNNLPDILVHAFGPNQLTPTPTKFYSQFVVDIEITNVGIHRAFPLIVERTPTKQMNVNKCVKMRVDMIMLQDLIRFQEISFKLGNGYVWKGDRSNKIRNEIAKLYDLRTQYKKEKNPTEQIIKLIMNSAYGKTIQKPIKTFLHFVSEQDYPWFVRDRYHQLHRDYVLENGSHLFELNKQKSNQFNNVLFGITVLSMSKRIMNEVMCLAEDLGIEIYYQDTDSMHIEHDKIELLNKTFSERYGRELIADNKLGCFHGDFEKINGKVPVCTYHISLGKKMYCDKLQTADGETGLHYRLKGIPQQVIKNHADKHFNGDIIALYEYLYKEGNSINFNLLDGKVCMMYSKTGDVMCRKEFMRKVSATAARADGELCEPSPLAK